jgi:hypothetical protein
LTIRPNQSLQPSAAAILVLRIVLSFSAAAAAELGCYPDEEQSAVGSAIWVEAYNRPLKETADDCCKSHRLADQLDRLALALGVRKLTDFYDWTEMTLAADAELRALEAIERGEESEGSFRNLTGQSISERQSTGEWYEPTEALVAVRALKDHIARSPSAVEVPAAPDDEGRYRGELMAEFELFQQMLERAVAEGQRFRFLIVP